MTSMKDPHSGNRNRVLNSGRFAFCFSKQNRFLKAVKKPKQFNFRFSEICTPFDDPISGARNRVLSVS